MGVRNIDTEADYEAAVKLAGNKLVVVDFYAVWCGPCRMIGPKFAEMAESHGEKAVFLRVDVDVNTVLAERFGVQAMPYFVFLIDGQQIDSLTGASEAKLKEKVEQYLR